ncbi:diaminopimelate decarboxylase [Thermomicrobiaceae bacterium CFH 74404]|uniref:Diaminopimelate decarboxylase n=1 Tax=Thermalbibacter longus TaxID=2951981 RepID=A0AA42B927_9BACT|nr:diaminopimelate decarboxylase [Thermalbibacter longus]MCM8747841.1 diaminopimelate decarboxylase [Thermalbibacter longus]
MPWPKTTTRDATGQLVIGGIPVPQLVAEFGTPLYIYDEATIRAQCGAYREALARHYPGPWRLVYAGKAYLSVGLLQLLAEEGMWLDVVSGGELQLALAAGFPPGRIILHGNNKSEDELRLALQARIGAVVVDNHYELDLLERLHRDTEQQLSVLVRVNPGVDAHTHAYRKTGHLDSKFGLLIETGDASRAVQRILGMPGLRLRGYHAHIGSQVFEVEPYALAVERLFDFAREMAAQFGVVPEEISPGGGLAIQYLPEDPVPDIDLFVRTVADTVQRAAREAGFPLPLLGLEPGRSIIGPAGIAVYRVGAIKEIPGVRRYVSVDGGMADNIRPALYQARYTAALANRDGPAVTRVTIVGKYCESGDVLVNDATLPEPRPGDLVAIAAAGAYCLAMASNYNLALRPAVILVREGQALLLQRRERIEDVLRREFGLHSSAATVAPVELPASP